MKSNQKKLLDDSPLPIEDDNNLFSSASTTINEA